MTSPTITSCLSWKTSLFLDADLVQQVLHSSKNIEVNDVLLKLKLKIYFSMLYLLLVTRTKTN